MIRLKFFVASFSDWPPDKKAIPGTSVGTDSLRHLIVFKTSSDLSKFVLKTDLGPEDLGICSMSKATDRDKYIYDLNTVDLKCKNISKNLSRVKKYFYAMKANSNIEVLHCIYNNGFGFECVSIEEIYYIKNVINGNPDILFTPNYCTINEYVIAFELNCTVIVDNEEVLINNPLIFSLKSYKLQVWL